MTTEREQILALAGEPAAWRDIEDKRRVIAPPRKPEADDDGWQPLYTADQLLAACKPLEDKIARVKADAKEDEANWDREVEDLRQQLQVAQTELAAANARISELEAQGEPVWYEWSAFGSGHGFCSTKAATEQYSPDSVRPLYLRAPQTNLHSLCIADETKFMLALANRIVGNANPEEDSRLEVAYSIARHLSLDWPSAYAPQAVEEWQPHTGECCPVSEKTLVEVRLKTGDSYKQCAADLDWSKDTEVCDPVIQYRVVTAPQAAIENERCRYGVCDEEEAHESTCTAWRHAPQAVPESEPSEDWFNALIEDVSALDCRYRGDPSYDHDAYYMRGRVIKMLERRRDAALAAAPSPEGEKKP